MKIIAAGYPKSGTTWLNRLLAEAIWCPQAGYLEMGSDYDEIAKEGADRKSNYEVWKTHSSYNAVISRDDVNPSKMICIVRDPRDIVISFYSIFPTGTIKDNIKKMYTGEFANSVNKQSWNDHVLGWINSESHIIRYEDMVFNTYNEIQKALDYLDIKVTPEHIHKAVENQSFEKKKYSSPKNQRFLRKGTSHQYLDEMNKHNQDLCIHYFGKVMWMLNYI